mgnify:CR=1 FL=1
MDKRRNKKYSNNWNSQKKSGNNSSNSNEKKFQFNPFNYRNEEAEQKKILGIQEIKSREIICTKCGKKIEEIEGAMADSAGQPIHFDCALDSVKEKESLGENEKIAYIGQGRFAVLFYENIRDQRHFTIKKIIEWEDKGVQKPWREEISSLYSKVN